MTDFSFSRFGFVAWTDRIRHAAKCFTPATVVGASKYYINKFKCIVYEIFFAIQKVLTQPTMFICKNADNESI